MLAELAWRPRVATQVPAQLVGLAAVWEWRWSLGRRGPGCGLIDVLGKDIAGAPARVLPWRRGIVVLWISSATIPPRVVVFWSHLISCVYDLDKDLHANTEVPPEPWFQRSRGALGLEGGLLLVLDKLPRQGSFRGRGGRPGKGLAGGVSPCPSAIHASGPEHGSGSLVSLLPLLSHQAWLRVRGCDCPRTSKGVQKGPLLLYTDAMKMICL